MCRWRHMPRAAHCRCATPRPLLADWVTGAAEALVPGPVWLATVALAAEADDRRRDEVRDLLNSAGLTAKVAVYPPWFVPKVDD